MYNPDAAHGNKLVDFINGYAFVHRDDGKYYEGISAHDLFMKSKKVTLYINIYKYACYLFPYFARNEGIFPTEEDAIRIGKTNSYYLCTKKIEIEE
jgi:hypothetical protein